MDIIGFLQNRIDARRLFHAYIISGANAEGRESAARYIARAAVCSGGGSSPCGVCRDCVKAQKRLHPDITVTEREAGAKELTVDAMRAVRAASAVVPNEAGRSAYIILGADTMNAYAQNAMLKIFEEPPSHAVFVLEAENPERLLPTVRSRCELIALPPDGAEANVPPLAQELISCAVKRDNAGVVSAAVQLEKLQRAELGDIVSALRGLAVRHYTEGGLSEERFSAITDAADRAEKYLAVNVSAGYVSGTLMSALTE